MSAIRKRDVVADLTGNHFIVLDVVGSVANCESVATREVFTIPLIELFPTERSVF